MATKVCTKCGVEKELEEFGIDRRAKSGRNTRCSECLRKVSAEVTAKKRALRKPEPVAKDGYKFCTKCGDEKALSEFGHNKITKSGLNSQCKGCARKYAYIKYRVEKNPNPIKRLTLLSPKSDKHEHRICTVCGEEKPFSEFELSKTRKNGISFRCKTCSHEYKMKWASKHIEERRAKQRAFKETHPELVKQRKQEEYTKHKDRYRTSGRAYYENNKEVLIAQQGAYRKKRNKEDPITKLADHMRHRLHQALKGKSKSDHTLTLLGCTVPELKLHLESQFTEGMSWDNWGFYGWHIDHIKPLAKFNLSLSEEQKKACHFSNLQPLWGKDNFVKGARYIE